MFFLVKTKRRVVWTSILMWIIVSSILYLALNYRYFYLANKWNIEKNGKTLTTSINNLIGASIAAGIDNSKDKFLLENYIKEVDIFIELSKFNYDEKLWTITNNRAIDVSRTIVELPQAELIHAPFSYKLIMLKENQPTWYSHLWRAWSFSNLEAITNIITGKPNRIWYRTEPLIVSWAITIFLLYFLYSGLLKNYREYKVIEAEKSLLKEEEEKNTKEIMRAEEEITRLKKLLEAAISEKKNLDLNAKEKGLTSELVNKMEENKELIEDLNRRLLSEIEEKNDYYELAEFYRVKYETYKERFKENVLIEIEKQRDEYKNELEQRARKEIAKDKLVLKTLCNLYPKLNFSKEAAIELHENKSNRNVIEILHGISSNLKNIPGIKQERWYGEGDQIEYTFSRGGRIIVDFSSGDLPFVKFITFNHRHCKS